MADFEVLFAEGEAKATFSTGSVKSGHSRPPDFPPLQHFTEGYYLPKRSLAIGLLTRLGRSMPHRNQEQISKRMMKNEIVGFPEA